MCVKKEGSRPKTVLLFAIASEGQNKKDRGFPVGILAQEENSRPQTVFFLVAFDLDGHINGGHTCTGIFFAFDSEDHNKRASAGAAWNWGGVSAHS